MVKTCNSGKVLIMAEPTKLVADTSEKVKGTYSYKWGKYLKETNQWEKNNCKLYVRFILYCLPSMETKLESMARFEAVVNNLDGLELIKLLQKAYFEQDGTKQAMLEIVKSDKQLILC